jgi:ferrochelatase
MGFLAEHVETLYDLDVEASEQARAMGLDWARVPALNNEPLLIEALAEAVHRTLPSMGDLGAVAER